MLSFSNIKDYLHFYCAPCLLGCKCANLFCAPLGMCLGIFQQNEANIQKNEFAIKGRNLCVDLLYVLNGKAYMIVYSKEEIEKLFNDEEVQEALCFFGHNFTHECIYHDTCNTTQKNSCIMKNIFEKLKTFAISSNSVTSRLESEQSLDSHVIKENNPFPHEIGLILGYPPQDVIQYYINNGKRYLFSGYWKVYTNPDWASSQFRKYDEARAYCMAHRVI